MPHLRKGHRHPTRKPPHQLTLQQPTERRVIPLQDGRSMKEEVSNILPIHARLLSILHRPRNTFPNRPAKGMHCPRTLVSGPWCFPSESLRFCFCVLLFYFIVRFWLLSRRYCGGTRLRRLLLRVLAIITTPGIAPLMQSEATLVALFYRRAVRWRLCESCRLHGFQRLHGLWWMRRLWLQAEPELIFLFEKLWISGILRCGLKFDGSLCSACRGASWAFFGRLALRSVFMNRASLLGRAGPGCAGCGVGISAARARASLLVHGSVCCARGGAC